MINTMSDSFNQNSLGFGEVKPIMASDAEIEKAVAQTDLPSLMACLAVLTGDKHLISEELRPPTTPMGGTIARHGGMSQETQKLARERAVMAIIRYRDNGCPPLPKSPPLLEEAMNYIAHRAESEYASLLRHEIGIHDDVDSLNFDLSDLAPNRKFKVAVIGAGLSGIACSYRLKQAGIPFTVFERRSDVGGVWQANDYPGCRLDTPNFAYSYSFAQKADWPQQFSKREEIQEYAATVTQRSGIRENILFNVEVENAQFQEKSCNWRLEWRDGDGIAFNEEFDLVISAVGQLDRPFIPDIEGLSSFAGTYHHSAEWPSDLDLKGKRVAVVGSGASAYQIVPAIVDQVKALHVVQRSPPWMLPTPDYHEDITPGMSWMLEHIPSYGRWFRFWQFWIAVEGRLPLVEVDEDWDHPISVGRANEALRQECLKNLEAQFEGYPDLRKAMTPNYPPGAKRMLRDNGVWAKALKSEHTTLHTGSIDFIEGQVVHFQDGSKKEIDVIIFATGFHSSDYLMPMTVTGRNGRDLHKEWNGDARAYLGITVPGYPNLFLMAGPNTSVVVNGSAVFSIECAANYTMSAIKHILKYGDAAVDCRQHVCDKYNVEIDAGNLKKAWGSGRTNSWYTNANGRASQTWPFNLLKYWNITRKYNPSDYEVLEPQVLKRAG